MLTSRVATAQGEIPMTGLEFDLYLVTIVAQTLALRMGGRVRLPVSELVDMAQHSARWERAGEYLVIQVELCRK